MKRSQLKQLIREVIEEMSNQRLHENETYKWNDGFTLSVDSFGSPTEDGWESFDYINGWTPQISAEFKAKVKDERPRTINFGMHKEGVYFPKAKAWYLVDSSG